MKKLLLIDNAVSHSPVFLNTLKKDGDYEITLVTTQEQYEQTISEEYDIAFLVDLNIPGGQQTNGRKYETAMGILADIRGRELPVLLLRGMEPQEVEEKARALGARVLRKPLMLGAILEELRQLELE
ncbi:hypothetical protein A3K73_09360 [Candidatus Pacearchaeota archaeon RBG_13_36_9]|nr:MAG: hypothetical protein A3K73_09360 [Candidatus Pacearchaeota archaeon RBG_13_36_9]